MTGSAPLQALVVKGLARSRQTFTGQRARTSYAINATGRKTLRAWLDTPPKPTALECEPLLRVFLAASATSISYGPRSRRCVLTAIRSWRWVASWAPSTWPVLRRFKIRFMFAPSFSTSCRITREC